MDNEMISPYREQWHDALNFGLIGAVGILLVLTGHRVFFYKMKDHPPVRWEDSAEASHPSSVPLPAAMQERDFSEKDMSVLIGRDLFSNVTQEEPPFQAATTIKVNIADLTRNLKVVGIVLADRAQAIIEDARTGESHFLYEGETINGAALRRIKEGKVIFFYQGEEMELVQ